jgi:hypothetical protein
LDGDMKKEYENNDKISEEIKERIIYLGDENQEIEDLIDLDFYLDCVMESYQGIFADQPEKIKPIEEIIEDINEKYKNTGDNEKLTKLLKKEFKNYKLGDFSKVDVAITLKRKLSENYLISDKFEEIVKINDKIEN